MALLARLVTLVSSLAAVLTALGVARTRQTQSSSKQNDFLAGKLPAQPPDGFYDGSADFDTRSWKGKTFSAAENRGMNVFARDDGTRKEQYPFRTYVGVGLQDHEIDVLKIDYDIPENPYWLRRILDEVVELENGELLGKVHVRLVPGLPFSLGYFRLEKSAVRPSAAESPASEAVPQTA